MSQFCTFVLLLLFYLLFLFTVLWLSCREILPSLVHFWWLSTNKTSQKWTLWYQIWHFLFSICGYIYMNICVITCLIKLFHFRLLGLWGGGKGNDLTPIMSSESSTFFHCCLCWLLITKLNTWNGLLPSYCSPKHVFFKLQVAI